MHGEGDGEGDGGGGGMGGGDSQHIEQLNAHRLMNGSLLQFWILSSRVPTRIVGRSSRAARVFARRRGWRRQVLTYLLTGK